MAARNKAWTPDRVRERIQASMLANRLADHAFGKCEMSNTQVTAALGLLKKCVPDLASIEHSGDVTQHFVMELPIAAESTETWSQQSGHALQ
jgi:hypothetical protein